MTLQIINRRNWNVSMCAYLLFDTQRLEGCTFHRQQENIIFLCRWAKRPSLGLAIPAWSHLVSLKVRYWKHRNSYFHLSIWSCKLLQINYYMHTISLRLGYLHCFLTFAFIFKLLPTIAHSSYPFSVSNKNRKKFISPNNVCCSPNTVASIWIGSWPDITVANSESKQGG